MFFFLLVLVSFGTSVAKVDCRTPKGDRATNNSKAVKISVSRKGGNGTSNNWKPTATQDSTTRTPKGYASSMSKAAIHSGNPWGCAASLKLITAQPTPRMSTPIMDQIKKGTIVSFNEEDIRDIFAVLLLKDFGVSEEIKYSFTCMNVVFKYIDLNESVLFKLIPSNIWCRN